MCNAKKYTKMNQILLILAISLIALGSIQAAEYIKARPSQSIGVRGMLKCNGRPASGVLVKLYDHDTFTLDDKIASGRTDSQGRFEISGTAHEISRITPKFNIYHDCEDWLPCQRKISINIPKSYITRGENANSIYDVGTMELAGQFAGESRDCLHK
uniref:Transthyretin-like protein 5 n=1 Tax=Panagrolaimus sp. ES5 TaxID=591445 RepID=A0AC34F8I7_9BILA